MKKDSCKDLSNQSDLGDNDESVFKNIQRRVYDTINVLDALNVIKKYKNIIIYNPHNEFFRDDDQQLISNLQHEKNS